MYKNEHERHLPLIIYIRLYMWMVATMYLWSYIHIYTWIGMNTICFWSLGVWSSMYIFIHGCWCLLLIMYIYIRGCFMPLFWSHMYGAYCHCFLYVCLLPSVLDHIDSYMDVHCHALAAVLLLPCLLIPNIYMWSARRQLLFIYIHMYMYCAYCHVLWSIHLYMLAASCINAFHSLYMPIHISKPIDIPVFLLVCFCSPHICSIHMLVSPLICLYLHLYAYMYISVLICRSWFRHMYPHN